MRIVPFLFLILLIHFSDGQIPQGYYNQAEGKIQSELKSALYQIIQNGHTTNTYTSLWTHFQKTDKDQNGYVWDMYSDCNFIFITDQCGNYTAECDCYNREHSIPVSWMGGGEPYPMYADLHHLVPVDAWGNNKRGSFPLGTVGSVSWTSNNGSKLGTCNYPGCSGTVFEPVDEYKGDFARIMFYMVTRYENLQSSWFTYDANASATLDGTTWPSFRQWSSSLYLQWHENDPVSAKELARNDSIYKIQHNRNPFIDRPEFARQIWGPDASISELNHIIRLYPVPVVDKLTCNSANEQISKITVKDMYGKVILCTSFEDLTLEIDMSPYPSGLYFVFVHFASGITSGHKVIKQ
jgi:endonuclease I